MFPYAVISGHKMAFIGLNHTSSALNKNQLVY